MQLKSKHENFTFYLVRPTVEENLDLEGRMQIHKVNFVDHEMPREGLQLRQPYALIFGQSATPKYQVSIRLITELKDRPILNVEIFSTAFFSHKWA